jgi:hypothetical protein
LAELLSNRVKVNEGGTRKLRSRVELNAGSATNIAPQPEFEKGGFNLEVQQARLFCGWGSLAEGD